MVQGTGSNVGKSMLVAGLCRYFTNQGLTVRPFKPQNMSNNAAVTKDGGEIGRAQALQALACKTDPTIHMNPVLLKPEGECGSQVIVQGKRLGSYKAKDFYNLKRTLMPKVLESFEHLKKEADLIIVEGAGSASEINLRENDIANMGFAIAAKLPVILAADIDRGGVLASIVGTHALLPKDEIELIKGYIINKFRGDPTLFTSAETLITEKTTWPSLGVCPWFPKANLLPAEDSQDLENNANVKTTSSKLIKVAVPVLPRIANFDDLDPLAAEPNVTLTLVKQGELIPDDTDLIILTGSKATISDLEALYKEGWHIDIAKHIRQGGHILGLCGGYQMLGRLIKDPHGLEGSATEIEGLKLLDIDTTLEPQKTLTQVSAEFLETHSTLSAYEMHMGKTAGPDTNRPLFKIKNNENQMEGAQNLSGKVMGTYLHGLFQADEFRNNFLQKIHKNFESQTAYKTQIETTLDELSEHIEKSLNIKEIEKAQCR
ncbi:cobyric acid synthase [Hyphomicrobiales bacterium 4NK60-0047b]